MAMCEIRPSSRDHVHHAVAVAARVGGVVAGFDLHFVERVHGRKQVEAAVAAGVHRQDPVIGELGGVDAPAVDRHQRVPLLADAHAPSDLLRGHTRAHGELQKLTSGGASARHASEPVVRFAASSQWLLGRISESWACGGMKESAPLILTQMKVFEIVSETIRKIKRATWLSFTFELGGNRMSIRGVVKQPQRLGLQVRG